MLKRLAATLMFCTLAVLPAICAEIHESTISTDISVDREVVPDTAKIRFMVENSGLNLASIKEKNDKIVNDAISAIKAQLAQNESIKTIAFSVRNVYSYNDKVRKFQKYEVSNGFEVKLKDLDKVSSIINLAMEKGVKNVSSINFMVEGSGSICNEMMAEAIKMGKSRAQYLSTAAGTSLDKVKSINPYCSLSQQSVQQPRFSNKVFASTMAEDAAMGAAYETIEPGTINARASVNMTYYLK